MHFQKGQRQKIFDRFFYPTVYPGLSRCVWEGFRILCSIRGAICILKSLHHGGVVYEQENLHNIPKNSKSFPSMLGQEKIERWKNPGQKSCDIVPLN